MRVSRTILLTVPVFAGPTSRPTPVPTAELTGIPTAAGPAPDGKHFTRTPLSTLGSMGRSTPSPLISETPPPGASPTIGPLGASASVGAQMLTTPTSTDIPTLPTLPVTQSGVVVHPPIADDGGDGGGSGGSAGCPWWCALMVALGICGV
eukprot:gene4473-811_t